MPAREDDRVWDPLLTLVGRVICLGASVLGAQYLLTTVAPTPATVVVLVTLALATALVGFTRLLPAQARSAVLVMTLLVFGAVGIHEAWRGQRGGPGAKPKRSSMRRSKRTRRWNRSNQLCRGLMPGGLSIADRRLRLSSTRRWQRFRMSAGARPSGC